MTAAGKPYAAPSPRHPLDKLWLNVICRPAAGILAEAQNGLIKTSSGLGKFGSDTGYEPSGQRFASDPHGITIAS